MTINYERMWREVCRERDELREQVEALNEALGAGLEAPHFVYFTGTEAKLWHALMNTTFLTKENILTVLYNGMADEPEQKIIDVYICKIRKKLRPYGIEIETIWGRGYAMTAEMKERARALEAACEGKVPLRPRRAYLTEATKAAVARDYVAGVKLDAIVEAHGLANTGHASRIAARAGLPPRSVRRSGG